MFLDKFYTKPEIARMCVDAASPFIGERMVIEPSAGSGSFLKWLPAGSIGYDVVPEIEGIICKNYLDVDIPEGVAVVGNPPFGKRGSLAKSFIKNSLQADIIAFILPSTFRKETMQKVFPDNFSLVLDLALPTNSFTAEGGDFNIPCVFQVWSRVHNFVNLRESAKVKQTTNDFNFVKKEDSNWFMFGAAPHNIIPSEDVNENNRGYYLKCSDEVREKLMNINWKEKGLSGAGGGVAWFTKQNIINIYLEEI